MATYRLWPSTNGPPTPISTANNDVFNTGFKVTQWGLWLYGYFYWVADGSQPTGPQKFCLWAMTSTNVGALVPGATVTSSALFTAGQWNFVALPVPVPLSSQFAYRMATGLTGNFPFTSGYWGTAGPGVNGITNGPLTAYSDVTGNGGTVPDPFNDNQSTFSSAVGNDPTVSPVGATSSSFNAWIDVLVSTTPPPGASYRLFPNMPVPYTLGPDTADNFTLGIEHILSQPCLLNKIWFYSAHAQLPTRTGVWSVPGASLLAATDNPSPSWSGPAGSGWVSVAYNGVVLPAGRYKTTVFNGAGVPAIWNDSTALYWSTGAGAGGITSGPLSAPDSAHADSPGQSSFHQGASFAFPDTNAGPFNYWVDLEVTPLDAPSSSIVPALLVM